MPELICAFCGKADHRLTPVHSSGEAQVSICDGCISICLSVIRDTDRESFERLIAAAHAGTRTVAVLAPITARHQALRQEVCCSFCSSMRNSRVIAGPHVFICYECVGLALHDIREGDRELFDRVVRC